MPFIRFLQTWQDVYTTSLDTNLIFGTVTLRSGFCKMSGPDKLCNVCVVGEIVV